MKYFEPSLAALRLVPRIVQTGALTKAASELHMSQSAASHALSTLESQLRSRLFVREHEGLRLSEAGQRLLPLMEDALSAIERIRAEAAGLAAFETGNLRVAAVPSLLSTILPPILREYGVRYPGIELSIFEGTDDEVHAWTKSGVAHVGFAALPVEGFAAEEVARDEWLALVPASGFQDRISITLKELAKNKFLMSGGGCERHIQRIFALAKVAIRETMMVKEMSTIHAMVDENLGVSLIPRLSFANSGACRALPLRPRLYRRIGMIRWASQIETPPIVAWQALIRAKLKTSSRATCPPPRAPARGLH
jgi:DNA-binding transcriptional LysR family regulator